MAGIVNANDDELNRITVEANGADHHAITAATNKEVAIIIANEPNGPAKFAQAVESAPRNHEEPSTSAQGQESRNDKVFKCCPDGFCEMVGRHKARNEQLSERETELRQRLATLECWMPAVTLMKMLTGEVDSSNIHNLIDEQAMTMSTSNARLHTSLSQHKDSRIRDIEAERKEADRRLEEARKLLREKQSAVDERAKQIEEAQRKHLNLEQKIGQLQEQFERDGIDLMKVTSGESIASFGPDDLACIVKLEELVAAEEYTKRQLGELERREEAYMNTLKAAGHIIPKNKKHPEVDELRDQLEVKSVANQQMADRICLLEDQVENLKGQLARCKDHVEQLTATHSKQQPITRNGGAGEQENGKPMVDKAIMAKATTVSSAAGSDHDTVRRNERGVIATVRTDSKETLTRVEVTDRSVQELAIDNIEPNGEQLTGDQHAQDPSLHPSILEDDIPTEEAVLPVHQSAPIGQGRLSPVREDSSETSSDIDNTRQSEETSQQSQTNSVSLESSGATMSSDGAEHSIKSSKTNNPGDSSARSDGSGSVQFAQTEASGSTANAGVANETMSSSGRSLRSGQNNTSFKTNMATIASEDNEPNVEVFEKRGLPQISGISNTTPSFDNAENSMHSGPESPIASPSARPTGPGTVRFSPTQVAGNQANVPVANETMSSSGRSHRSGQDDISFETNMATIASEDNEPNVKVFEKRGLPQISGISNTTPSFDNAENSMHSGPESPIASPPARQVGPASVRFAPAQGVVVQADPRQLEERHHADDQTFVSLVSENDEPSGWSTFRDPSTPPQSGKPPTPPRQGGARHQANDQTFVSLVSENDEASGWSTFRDPRTPPQSGGVMPMAAAGLGRQDRMADPGRVERIADPGQDERIELSRAQLEMWLANVTDIRRQISRCPACQTKQRALVQMCKDLCFHLRLQSDICTDEGPIDNVAAQVAHTGAAIEPGAQRPVAGDPSLPRQQDIKRLNASRIEAGHFAKDYSMAEEVSEYNEDSKGETFMDHPIGMSTRLEDTDAKEPRLREVSQFRENIDSTLSDGNDSRQSARRDQQSQHDGSQIDEQRHRNDDARSVMDSTGTSNYSNRRGIVQHSRGYSLQQNDGGAIVHTVMIHDEPRGQAQAIRQKPALRIVEDVVLPDPGRLNQITAPNRPRQIEVAAMELAIWRESIADIRRYISRCPICRAKRRALISMCKAICDHLQVPSNQCEDGDEYNDVRKAVIPQARGNAVIEGAPEPDDRPLPREMGRTYRAPPRRVDSLPHDPAIDLVGISESSGRIHTTQESRATSGQDSRVNESSYYGEPVGTSTPLPRKQAAQSPRTRTGGGLFDSQDTSHSRSHNRGFNLASTLESSGGMQSTQQSGMTSGQDSRVNESSYYGEPVGTSTILPSQQATQSPRTRTGGALFDSQDTSHSRSHDRGFNLASTLESSRGMHSTQQSGMASGQDSQVNDSTYYGQPPRMEPITGLPFGTSTPTGRQRTRQQSSRTRTGHEVSDSYDTSHSRSHDRGFDLASTLESSRGMHSTQQSRMTSGQDSRINESTQYGEHSIIDPINGLTFDISSPTRRRRPSQQSPRTRTSHDVSDSHDTSHSRSHDRGFDLASTLESSRGMHSTQQSRMTSGQDSRINESTQYGEPSIIDPINGLTFDISSPTRRRRPIQQSPRTRTDHGVSDSHDTSHSRSHDRGFDLASTLESSRGMHSTQQSQMTSGQDSRMNDSTRYGDPQILIRSHDRTMDTTAGTPRSRGETSPRQRSGKANNQHYETLDSTQYGELQSMDPITGLPFDESTPKRRKQREHSRQAQSSRESAFEGEDSQFLEDESSYMTYGTGGRIQYGLEEMRGEFSGRENYTGTSIGPIIRRKMDKGRTFDESNDRKIPVLGGLSGSPDQDFQDAPSLPYMLSDSESQRDSRSEEDEGRQKWRMAETRYVPRPISREQSKKITRKGEKDREYRKSAIKKETISDTEHSSISNPSSPHDQSKRQRSCCACPFDQITPNEYERSTAMDDNCRPCPTKSSDAFRHETKDIRRNKSKRNHPNEGKLSTMSSVKAQTTIGHRDKHLPNYDCEVCDCEPCGTPSSYHSSPGKARVNVATNVSPRSTKRNRSVSAKKARTNG